MLTKTICQVWPQWFALVGSRISCVSADSMPIRTPALHIVPSVIGYTTLTLTE